MQSGALDGLRVLDLSRVLAGPWAGQVLGDLGADVVKVERVAVGDDTRAWGPPWLDGAEGRTSAYFLCANRNKRSVAVDLASEDDRLLVENLAAQADVVLENFKVGDLRQFGLDYASLKLKNSRLIYCSVTGFGQTGPYAQRAGYDFLIQGMGGLMSLSGRADGEPGAGPMKVGVALVDVMTGLYAAIAVLAALNDRHRTGEGQYIDLSLLDVQVACLANQASNFLVSGQAPSRLGNAHPNIVPYQEFPTADGFMILAIGNDGQFARFSQEADHPEWSTDERFRSNPQRVIHRAHLIPLIEAVARLKTTAEWMETLERVGVPCGPINSLDRVFADPQIRARGIRVDVPGANGESIPLVASPIRMSRTPVQYRRGPPELGEHRAEILRDWLGLVGDR
jgi:crotonobetainyl-CoA:carnitine CoA-transferase CaiB-like acyl-CoA transferase